MNMPTQRRCFRFAVSCIAAWAVLSAPRDGIAEVFEVSEIVVTGDATLVDSIRVNHDAVTDITFDMQVSSPGGSWTAQQVRVKQGGKFKVEGTVNGIPWIIVGNKELNRVWQQWGTGTEDRLTQTWSAWRDSNDSLSMTDIDAVLGEPDTYRILDSVGVVASVVTSTTSLPKHDVLIDDDIPEMVMRIDRRDSAGNITHSVVLDGYTLVDNTAYVPTILTVTDVAVPSACAATAFATTNIVINASLPDTLFERPWTITPVGEQIIKKATAE